jgi:hypothetical protein
VVYLEESSSEEEKTNKALKRKARKEIYSSKQNDQDNFDNHDIVFKEAGTLECR